jgi:hypothetical protein
MSQHWIDVAGCVVQDWQYDKSDYTRPDRNLRDTGLDVKLQLALGECLKQREIMRKIQIAVMAAAFVGAMSAKADLVYVSAASATYGVDLYWAHGTMGSQFTVSSSVTVFQAGIWDYLGDGLVDSHAVGVWDSAGNLLDTATVQAGTVDPLMDGFRWASLATPLTLNPGQTYHLGAYYPGYIGTDPIAPNSSDWLAAGSHTVDSPFTWITDAYGPGNGFEDPTQTYITQGFFGPNLAVPEPTTVIAGALLLLPFGASTLRLLRRKQ